MNIRLVNLGEEIIKEVKPSSKYMKETEVKILNVDRSKIVKTLLSMNAEKIFDDEICTIFFDFRDAGILNKKNLLRLRQAGSKSTLTYKKMLITESVKEAEEYEVEISNLQTMKEILELLGLKETKSLVKHRSSYKIQNTRFDIDSYEGELDYIPTFLEIESDIPDSIYRYAQLLGFSPTDCLPWSTEQVISHYLKDKKQKIKRTSKMDGQNEALQQPS
jgi:adenylate cyclase, class 2